MNENAISSILQEQVMQVFKYQGVGGCDIPNPLPN